MIDGQLMSGVFASDLTLAEVQQLRALQRWPFRDHSFDGQFGVVTFEDFIDLALTAGRPVGIYPGGLTDSWGPYQ
jgi:glycerophosphoryl diester phosphodiesterase